MITFEDWYKGLRLARKTVIGRKTVYLETVGSTMDEARRLASQGWEEGVIVAAGRQTRGRGRKGRVWVSEPGGLYFSIILRPPKEVLGILPLALGVAVARGIEDAVEVNIGLKWPNDLLVEDKKLGGILCEAYGEGKMEHVVAGVGLNVLNKPPEDGTSLLLVSGKVDVPFLICELVGRIDKAYSLIRKGESGRLLDDWKSKSVTLGRKVKALLPGGKKISGLAVGISDCGDLLLDVGGRTVALNSADVSILDLKGVGYGKSNRKPQS